MSDELRNLVYATVAAAVVGAGGGFLCHALAIDDGAFRARLLLMFAGLTGIAIPLACQRFMDVVGPILAVPVAAGAASLAITLALLMASTYGGVSLLVLALAGGACVLGGVVGAIFESIHG